MKKKFFLVVVVFLVLVVGFTLGIVHAQKSKTGEPPLSKYLVLRTITRMDWLLEHVETHCKIKSVVYCLYYPQDCCYFLDWLMYNYDENRITARFSVSTDVFEKMTAVRKKEKLSEASGDILVTLKGQFPEFRKERDYKAEFYSLQSPDILVAEYVNGEFKIVGESEEQKKP